jgi:DNA repair exonuclease SbcCD ATPase subunit
MRMRSIGIKDFRKLTGPVRIDEIGDGITVISGDNEEGKSTVLEAIRTVLFTRHRVSGGRRSARRRAQGPAAGCARRGRDRAVEAGHGRRAMEIAREEDRRREAGQRRSRCHRLPGS